MAKTNEKITGIIAEIQKSDCDEICPWWADGGSCDFCPLGGSGKNCSFSKFANRLEAAWKREKAAIEADALAVGGLVEASRATAEKSSVVGDCAKLREALKTVKRYLDGYTVNVLEMRRKVDAALAAPPRNCDVGTEQEQARRFLKYCMKQDCEKACPFRDCKNSHECAFAWAQMPYEEGASS